MDPTQPGGDVTRILVRLTQGDEVAQEELFSIVYSELRRLARSFMRYERPDHTLQTTALVNEACLKLLGMDEVRWEDRSHFFQAAARAMRRVLIDHARARSRQKRGQGATKLPLDEIGDEAARVFSTPRLDIIALDNSLTKLAEEHGRQARVVELLFYAGLTRPETAEVLDVTRSTVDRDWRFARTWLIREMKTEIGRGRGTPGNAAE
ncbi:MAG: sigma-70 family RNA polymerase sigma factor [Candidatus Latescibacteria bacterium]|nr:sigma-70 family RNA polymerase sigma factor [Candidatus Latescibacterota bacterium]